MGKEVKDMMICDRWQAKTALMLSIGIVAATATPIAAQAQFSESLETDGRQSFLIAQNVFDSARVSVPSGTRIQVGYDETGDDGEEVERIILAPDETADITVTVEEPIRSDFGTVLVPAGSEIEGELRPLEGDTMGSQFYAETLRLPNGQVADIDAASAAVLAEILGSIDVLEVLGGAGLGALGILIFGGGEEEVDVVVVDPDTDLDLTLRSDLRI